MDDSEILMDVFSSGKLRPKISEVKTTQYITNLTALSENLGVPPRSLLLIYERLGDFRLTMRCVICDVEYSTVVKPSKTCGNSCQLKNMHRNFSDEKRLRTSEKRRIGNEKRRITGELSKNSRRAFETRRSRYTEDEIKTQYIHAEEIKKQRASERRAEEIELFKFRLSQILEWKSPRFVLRMALFSGNRMRIATKKLSGIITDLVELGFVEFESCRSVVNNKLISLGMSRLGYCYECGSELILPKRFCSYKCSNSSTVTRNKLSDMMMNLWNDPEYRRKQEIHLASRYVNMSTEDRSKWSVKMLATMGEDGRLSRRDSALKTKLERGVVSSISVWGEDIDCVEYRKYMKDAIRYTKMNCVNLVGIENRGKHTFHVDHIFPIQKGFVYKVPTHIIGAFENLQMLPAFENQSKNNKITEIPEIVKPYLLESGYYD